MRGYRRVRAVRETRGAKNFGCEFDGYKMRPPKLRENHIWEERGGAGIRIRVRMRIPFSTQQRTVRQEGRVGPQQDIIAETCFDQNHWYIHTADGS